MESKRIINYSEVSEVLAGNRNTIRADRANEKFSEPIGELMQFLDGWITRNSKSKKTVVTVKSKKIDGYSCK